MSTRAGVPVSVVIPTYNRADRLEGAILSAVDQDPGPLEIIVVDDASTDGTDAARLEAIDRRVRVIRHLQNRGSAAARNTGIDAARGDWIAFLDHDDQWLPGKLERQWPQVAGLDASSSVFACANVVFDGGAEDGRVRNSRPPEDGEDISRYFLIHNCTFHTSTLLMPARLARMFRFDERLANHEDWDLLLRLLRSGARYLYCHEPLARYWNASDPTRITKRPSLEPTLHWLRTAGDLVAADAAATYYFRAIFRRHFAGNPRDALLMGLRLALRSPRAAWWVTRKTLSTLGERSGLEPGNRKR